VIHDIIEDINNPLKRDKPVVRQLKGILRKLVKYPHLLNHFEDEVKVLKDEIDDEEGNFRRFESDKEGSEETKVEKSKI